MNKKNDRDFLKDARNFGILSLLWAIVTVNPLLIIATILSWTAFSNRKKGFAKGALFLYIAGGILSTALTLSIAFLGNIISIFSGISKIAGGAFALIAATVAADAVIAFAARFSRLGIVQLEKEERKRIEKQNSVGLFSGETYTGETEEK